MAAFRHLSIRNKNSNVTKGFPPGCARQIYRQEEAMIRVQAQDFDIGAEIAALRKGRSDAGAIVAFAGTVRDQAKSGTIAAMTLEHYPGMTEKELARIEAEARARWPLLESLIVHRIGRLLPGDNIVLAITISAHRQAAFEAAQFLMDYLKTSAPFWKTEETSEGRHWVAAQESGESEAARCNK
jgi:molybdopterin synthase catalytic subunit